jgi:hypothetical protein
MVAALVVATGGAGKYGASAAFLGGNFLSLFHGGAAGMLDNNMKYIKK